MEISENRSSNFSLHIISCKVICIYCVQMLNKKMRKSSQGSCRFVYNVYILYNAKEEAFASLIGQYKEYRIYFSCQMYI